MSSVNDTSLMHEIDAHDSAKASKSHGGSATLPSVPGWAQALIIVAALGVGGWSVWTFSGSSNAAESSSRVRAMIDAETGKVFENYQIREGDKVPFANPETGRATLWPAEMCFWTKDGGAKAEPTYVLLNGYVGIDKPTTCPDCGRAVVPHNPMPPVEVLAKLADQP